MFTLLFSTLTFHNQFLLSKWYKRDEVGLRTAILYCGNIISNAFGALMASGILSRMNGTLGHAAWRYVENYAASLYLYFTTRWLFYIEGALTIGIAIAAIFILPDFPTNTRWLSPQERALALRRMEEDAGVGDQEETEGDASGLWLAVTDWKVWWLALALTSQVVALSFNAFFPTLSATMGFNTTVTLLLCAPPFVLTAILAFVLSR
jgi:sugar phosphate permease